MIDLGSVLSSFAPRNRCPCEKQGEPERSVRLRSGAGNFRSLPYGRAGCDVYFEMTATDSTKVGHMEPVTTDLPYHS